MLVEGASGNPNGVNEAGVLAGISENGAIDPQSEFPPEFDAVVWTDRQIINLGTFGGTFSYANAGCPTHRAPCDVWILTPPKYLDIKSTLSVPLVAHEEFLHCTHPGFDEPETLIG